MKKYFTLNRLLITAVAAAVAIGLAFLIWWQKEITVGNADQDTESSQQISPITGKPCSAANQRPIAVMYASDPVARPLSGISQADLVIEMPVTPMPNEVTRMMAVFQCNEPQEIGSIRSARGQFLSIVAGLSALYAHWGGEREALNQLNAGVLDNIDALKYDGTTYYRKTEIPRPHNGFTTLALLREKAQELDYSLINTFTGYPHKNVNAPRNVSSIVDSLSIDYAAPYNVRWDYDREQKFYKRFRNGTPELDSIGGMQVNAQNIVVLQTTAEPVNFEYIDVQTSGQGQATLYQAGTRMNIFWKKDPAVFGSKLQFLDGTGKEISFVPGTIWIEVTLTP